MEFYGVLWSSLLFNEHLTCVTTCDPNLTMGNLESVAANKANALPETLATKLL